MRKNLLLLAVACVLGACGPQDTTQPLDAATDAPRDCRPTWVKIEEECGPRPPHWVGQPPAEWEKLADIWMNCVIFVE